MKTLILLLSVVSCAFGQITINWSDVHQTIDGFGAAAAFGSPITDAQADTLYGTGPGQIGLSLLRLLLVTDPAGLATCDPNTVVSAPAGTGSILAMDLDNAQKAVARGVRIWASSWSPPGSMKSSSAYCGYGTFAGNSTNYASLASLMANFVPWMQTNYGVPVSILSPQNEPGYNSAAWPTSSFTPNDFHAFIPYLRSALDSVGATATKIMAGEYNSWDFGNLTKLMSDPITAAQVDYVAAHNYTYLLPSAPPTLTGLTTQHVWQTEVSDFNPYDGSIASAMTYARQIHAMLANAHVNAWLYWETTYFALRNNDALIGTEIPVSSATYAKRAYAIGQWSHFVRPGWVMIGVTNATSLLVTAFKDPVRNSFAIVVLNNTASAVTNQGFALSGVSATSLTPYITDSARSLTPQAAVTTTGGTSFTYTIPAKSIVTFHVARGKVLQNGQRE